MSREATRYDLSDAENRDLIWLIQQGGSHSQRLVIPAKAGIQGGGGVTR